MKAKVISLYIAEQKITSLKTKKHMTHAYRERESYHSSILIHTKWKKHHAPIHRTTLPHNSRIYVRVNKRRRKNPSYSLYAPSSSTPLPKLHHHFNISQLLRRSDGTHTLLPPLLHACLQQSKFFESVPSHRLLFIDHCTDILNLWD
jgi:hypothetical protein